MGGSGLSGDRDPSIRSLLDRIREDAPITRRDYLRILVTVSGGLLAGTVAVAAGAFRRHGAGSAPPLKIASRLERGEPRYFNYPGPDDQAIALRLWDGRLVAYSAVCTHLACAVVWRPERSELHCPCHNGAFDPATGAVLAGPPPRPLPRVVLEERPDGIYAVGTAEGRDGG
ncbi:MAG TPA: Rieske 2Fe-2S domain-containing protein [Actinomycetota bacterium]|nr:Rieske 2Fe-2S domain-containing protein [Actinomycetota bacterium]